ALARREHFDKAGIRELVPTFTVLERAPQGSPEWTSVVRIEPLARIAVTAERLDKMFAARLLAGRPDMLFAANLRMPEGTVLAQEQVGPGAEVPSTLSARFSPEAAVPSIELTLELL